MKSLYWNPKKLEAQSEPNPTPTQPDDPPETPLICEFQDGSICDYVYLALQEQLTANLPGILAPEE